MPTAKEFTIRMEDRPGTLGKVSRALADRGVNILAFQSFSTEGKALTRIVVDTPVAAKKVLDSERLTYTEAEVAQVKLSNRTGELARAASRLGEANININYGYCGLEAGTNAPLLIFGVAEVGRGNVELAAVSRQAPRRRFDGSPAEAPPSVFAGKLFPLSAQVPIEAARVWQKA
jgi:hypothetical protein